MKFILPRNPFKKLSNRIKNLLLFIVLIALMLIALSGKGVSIDKDIYEKIGRFTVRPYKYGLYLTEAPSGLFHNFSVYDFYYTDAYGNETRLQKNEERPFITLESTFRKNPNGLLPKITSFFSYFRSINVSATFNDSPRTLLTTLRDGNKLSLILSEYDFSKIGDNALSLTLSYEEQDFIFDNEKNLYTLKTPEEVADFTYIFGESLNKIEDPYRKNKVPSNNALYIANNDTIGVIKIFTNQNGVESVYVNRDKNLIEFNMQKNSQPKIEVYLFDNLGDALKQ